MEQPGILEQLRRLTAQRRAREVLLAILLTIAALAFLASAMFGGDAPREGSMGARKDAPYDTAHKHAPR